MHASLTVFACSTTFLIFLSACGSSETTPESTMQRLSEITRNQSDGSVINITINYTPSGNLLSETLSRDGGIYQTNTYESSADGTLIRRSEDTDQDGVENQSSTYVYLNGLGLSRINRIGPNTLIDLVDVFQFDGAIAVSRNRQDVDDVATSDLVDESSGTLVSRRVYGYQDGRISENNIDTDGDGEFDRQEVYSYNPDGTLATTILSSDTDGVISSSTYTYVPGICNNNSGNSSTAYFCVTTE